MSVSAVWEKFTALSLRPKGVRRKLLKFDSFQMSTLSVQASPSQKTNKKLICVHGLGSSAAAYGSLLPHLAKHWSLIMAPSAPGHGASPPFNHVRSLETKSQRSQSQVYQAWETCLLELAKEGPVDLLGVSLGGAIAIRFAAQHPEKVSSLMLCSPAGALLDEIDIAHLKSVFKMDHPSDGMRFLRTLYHEVPWWGFVLAPLVRKSLSQPEAQMIINQLKPGDGLDPSELKNLNLPILLIWGKRERILPSSSLDKLLTHFPKHLVLLQPDHFSHTPQKEHPKELAQHLIYFQTHLYDKSSSK